MPSYIPADVEPRWQAYWDANATFRTLDPTDASVAGKPKYYILDMFPYPSGSGLHVGHPEGYTATDILARFQRMRGFHVLHPMGWDAFGLPAEQHAIATGEHPSINTKNNVDTFRRQIKSLGFSYDWQREVNTTDPDYFRWTQWIFLQIYDTWYDPVAKKGRPISELPIPADVIDQQKYIDSHRLAYLAEVPVNWCEALGTVLSNEEVIDGKSERGSHPVVRRPLKQWLLRITAYAERLIDDLEPLDWSESIKQMQRNWIGKSEGAEVQFQVPNSRFQVQDSNLEPGTWNLELSVFTTRPDTLFGATYIVLSPEHELVARITTAEQEASIEAYQQQASRKSEFERTEMAKTKSGVFTGAYAVNPVNKKEIPIWIADYVLAGYGTGAIMAVPAHDERDFEFALEHNLAILPVVEPSEIWLVNAYNPLALAKVARSSYFRAILGVAKPSKSDWDRLAAQNDPQPADPILANEIEAKLASFSGASLAYCEACLHLLCSVATNGEASVGELEMLRDCYLKHPQYFALDDHPSAYIAEGKVINSGFLDGMTTEEAKRKITAWLVAEGNGEAKVNYKLRDWLFSRQRYWGEPFPILHELDAAGNRTGVIRTLAPTDLPLTLPTLADFKPTGSPDGPLAKATDWLTVELDGKKYRRETNTMPQWAGSCWYYLRYIDPQNTQQFADAGKLNHWLPVDLYIGGAEHAVLHLLYSRFWHKVLYDRGYVNCVEPFQKLVNQGMILGEDGQKMSKARGNVINPDSVVAEFGADSLRLFEMFMGPLEAVKPWNTKGVEGVHRFLHRAWRLLIDDTAVSLTLNSSVKEIEPDRDGLRILHRTIQKVTDDTARLSFNTAISAMMEFCNYFTKLDIRPRAVLEPFVLLLAPYAPHIAEELWAALGHPTTLAYEPWPKFDPELTKVDSIEVPVQINGKLKAKLHVPAEIDAAELEATALADAKVIEALAGKTPKKVIVVPKKVVSIVV